MEAPVRDKEFSAQYIFVRSRQLEATFPGDASTGTWPITCCRILRGWGVPTEDVWPYNGDASAWPPQEPPNVDAAAKPNRCGRYQRVRTLSECKAVLGLTELPVGVSLEITDKWGNAPGGRIPPPTATDVVRGFHSVLVHGYDDAKAEFSFQNSWGAQWGDGGHGYISYESFEAAWVEGWLTDFPESWAVDWPGNKMLPKSQSGVIERGWGVPEHGGGIFHIREFVRDDDERLAWAFAIQRSGFLEVEEFFVRPQFRRAGYGKKLMHLIGKLATVQGCSLKFWISYADTAPENLAMIEKLVLPLGLRVVQANVRFAPYVATGEGEAAELERVHHFQSQSARPIAPYRPKSLE